MSDVARSALNMFRIAAANQDRVGALIEENRELRATAERAEEEVERLRAQLKLALAEGTFTNYARREQGESDD